MPTHVAAAVLDKGFGSSHWSEKKRDFGILGWNPFFSIVDP